MQAEGDSAALRHEPPVEFSGEEALGRYLDLHGHHMAFVNSAFGRQQDYAEYVAGLTDFDQIQRRHRTGAAYQCASTARGLPCLTRFESLCIVRHVTCSPHADRIWPIDTCLRAVCHGSPAPCCM